ncbi:MAG: L-threonylcarbamoyladenylate synthase [Candidatus Cryptobacteroides sp.]
MYNIENAIETLRKGGIILYPTDTVWGLGCDATDKAAVARIFEIKHRSDSKSLVLLASDLDMVARYIREIPEMAIQLVEVNDKPMTIIYPDAIYSDTPSKYALASNTVAEDGTVGIRIPLGGFCLDLVKKFGRPIVSTSANISGEKTPANFAEISEDIKNAVDYCVDPSADKGSTHKASSIIKVGLDATIKIIRE